VKGLVEMAAKISLKIYPYKQKQEKRWIDTQTEKNVSLLVTECTQEEMQEIFPKLLSMGYVATNSRIFLKRRVHIDDLLQEQKKLCENFNIYLHIN
jgi:hypothetical protein